MTLPVTAFISPGGGEFLLIMLVLILLFGAKDAPRILRTIQTTLDKIQRAAAGFRYKIMYGDLHASSDEKPYDVDAQLADEGDDYGLCEMEKEDPEAETGDPEPEETEPPPPATRK